MAEAVNQATLHPSRFISIFWIENIVYLSFAKFQDLTRSDRKALDCVCTTNVTEAHRVPFRTIPVHFHLTLQFTKSLPFHPIISIKVRWSAAVRKVRFEKVTFFRYCFFNLPFHPPSPPCSSFSSWRRTSEPSVLRVSRGWRISRHGWYFWVDEDDTVSVESAAGCSSSAWILTSRSAIMKSWKTAGKSTRWSPWSVATDIGWLGPWQVFKHLPHACSTGHTYYPHTAVGNLSSALWYGESCGSFPLVIIPDEDTHHQMAPRLMNVGEMILWWKARNLNGLISVSQSPRFGSTLVGRHAAVQLVTNIRGQHLPNC